MKKTDLELISGECVGFAADRQPTSVRLVETRKCKDGEERFYDVRAEIYLGGETFQALVSVCVTDCRGFPTFAIWTALDIDYTNPLTDPLPHNPRRDDESETVP